MKASNLAQAQQPNETIMRYIYPSLLIVFLCSAFQLEATHIRGGTISASRISPSLLRYKITVQLLIDTDAGSIVGRGTIEFGDGASAQLIEAALSHRDSIIDHNTTVVIFELEHTYPQANNYKISYSEPSRNTDVLNLSNANDSPFYIESNLRLDVVLGSNNGPHLLNMPVSKAIVGTKYMYNPAIFDPDGDSLHYELVVPQLSADIQVKDYVYPNHPRFYNDPTSANEQRNDVATLAIDPIVGNLVWDAPGMVGTYILAIKVEEWRKLNGEDFLVGSIILDFEVEVKEEDIDRPVITLPKNTCYEEGANISEQISISSASDTPMRLSFYSSTENATLNGMSLRAFNSTSQFANTPQQIVFELTDPKTFDYYSLVAIVQQESDAATVFSWSSGFLFGFGCHEIERGESGQIVTVIDNDQQDSEVFRVHLFRQTGKVIINRHSFSRAKLSIVALSGQNIISRMLIPGEQELTLTTPVTPGIYVARLEIDGRVRTQRVLVE